MTWWQIVLIVFAGIDVVLFFSIFALKVYMHFKLKKLPNVNEVSEND